MANDKIMVSVGMITYNHERFVAHAIESIVNQKTNFKFELIIHDDASTDSTAEIIKKYAAEYPDIIVPILQSENQYSKGISIGETFVYPKVRGKYYAFCEGDDYWVDMDKLQKQVDYLENHPGIPAVAGRNVTIDKYNTVLGISHEGEQLNRVFKQCDAMRLGTDMLHPSTLLRRTVFINDVRFLSGSKCNKLGGHSYLIYYFANAGGIYIMDDIFSAWRKVIEQNGDSFSSRSANHSISFGLEHVRTLKNYQEFFGTAYDFSDRVVKNAETLILALLVNKEENINKLPVFIALWKMLTPTERIKVFHAVKRRITKRLMGKKNEK